ncbi:MAG: methyltransferase domain-containing protein [Terriglobia bacterium]
MRQRLLQLLACPDCRASLRLEADECHDGEILAGNLICAGCGKAFAVRGGIPRFVPGDAYASTFSFEWKKWTRTQFDTASRRLSEATFVVSTGKLLETLAGRVVFDAGCGSGRFMDVVARVGAEVVGVDMSFAIEAAYQNLSALRQCHFVQADLMHLPFKPQSFDFVYSIGVLPFTPNTKAAFLSVLGAVAPGGSIAIWVYPRRRLADTFRHFPDRVNEVIGQDANFSLPLRWQRLVRPFAGLIDWTLETSSDAQRLVTTRLPPRLLYALCHAAIPLYYVYRIPLFYPLRLVTKIAMHPDPEWRVLDTFDWYSPRYQWKHTFGEVRGWFEQARLEEIALLPRAVAVTGRRPARSSSY